MALIYETHPADYLERARTIFSAGKGESYFYAALELRSGIEARIKDYLKAIRHISNAKKKGWEIAKLAKGIEAVFKTGEQTCRIQLLDERSKEVGVELYYTPVSERAQQIVKKLGNYLHSNYRQHKVDEYWWKQFRDLIEEGILELDFCTRGNLMGVPLINYSTGSVELILESPSEQNIKFIQKALRGEVQIVFGVDYLDSITARQLVLRPSQRPCTNSDIQILTVSTALQLHSVCLSDEEFSKRQKAGESALETAAGKRYMEQVSQYIANALVTCFPKETSENDDNCSFVFTAYITEMGHVVSSAVKPVTEATECFAKEFSSVVLPKPPKTGLETLGLLPFSVAISIVQEVRNPSEKN